MIDWKLQVLTPEQIFEKSKTKEGKDEVKKYFLRARIAYGVQAMFESLGMVPSAEEQHRACQVLYERMFRVPVDDVMAWIQSVAEGLESNEIVGNC